MSSEVLEATGMVEGLRVAELRSLLSSMGKNKSGLKKDLVQRTKELLSQEYRPELLSAIRELHRVRQQNPTSRRRSHVIAMLNNVCSAKPDARAQSPVLQGHMIKLPFYETLETIVAPLSLVPQVATTLQTSFIKFRLTEDGQSLKNSQLSLEWDEEILPLKKQRDGLKSFQVVLRICYTDSIGVEDDQYPPKIGVLVNNQICTIKVRYTSDKDSMEPSRPCCPINLTPLLNQFADNHVAVTWGNFGKYYSAAVYLVRVFTSAELLEQLQSKAVESKEHCKQKICEKLRCDPKNEIATTGLQVSLLCPLAKMRMSIPCRARTCAHLQCFDAAFYLQMNEGKPRWTCPVCHKLALFDALQIDSLLKDVLQSTDQSVEEIEYLSNGSWRAVGEKTEHSKDCISSTKFSKMPKSKPVLLEDVVDLTQCSSDEDNDDHGSVLPQEEIILTHIRTERVRFSKKAV